ncbi:hypothetical protein VRU48_19160 [Pedobacter sp. KR3-3]|uniref:Uncharacterized protein n=1 Tax=Pedobacter albus TaxID=3113905 RepID=A0ABU7ID25_9SPHI|nr:hypothetical protein [Pedobacter sp. KR3-3]MEE1947254.1 hypothetical protein [Pedobacter sp. KR3-3]
MMKIELKKIEHSPSLSEETEAFTAHLYIDGKHAAYLKNQGTGGMTDIHPTDQAGAKMVWEAVAYCKTLPPQTYTGFDGKEHSLAVDLQSYIDQLLYEHLEAKFQARMERAMADHIVIGHPDDNAYRTLKLKFEINLLLVHPRGPEILTDILRTRVLPQLTEGQMVMNTNLPEELLQKAGLKEGQYQQPKARNEEKQVKKTGRRNHKGPKP